MDEIGFIILIGLAVLAIPILGVVGFARTFALKRQIEGLQRSLLALEGRVAALGSPGAAVPAPPAEPWHDRTADGPGVEPPAAEAEPEAEPDDESDEAEDLPIAASVEAGTEAVAGPAIPPAGAAPPAPPRSLEEIIGTRWVVWVGGVALGLGGLFLVRYSIEQGWFGPTARCVAGALFALALVAAGEWMRRRERESGPLVALARIPGADIPSILTAAGTLSAFGTIYAAQALYGLIGAALAFVLLAVVGIATMLAAALHGPMLAGFGLLASYVAPLLVASGNPQPWPVVLYLVVVAGCAYGLARLRLWLWLAIAAAAGAAVWAQLFNDLQHHGLEAAVHIAVQAALAAVLLAGGPHLRDDEETAPVDWLATGVLAVYAFLASELLVEGLDLGATRVPFAAAMLAVLGATALRVPPAAGGALAGAVVAVSALFGWPLAQELASETPTVLPAPGASAPLSDTFWLFQTFGGLTGAALLAGGFLRILNGERLHRVAAGLYAAAAVLGPIALLVVAWWRLDHFDQSVPFAGVAGVVALAYVGGARQLKLRFLQSAALPLAYGLEAFAAAALGALAVGLTMALDKGSLTVALALAALGAAWVTTREPLGLLRFAIGGIGIVVAGRLAWDPTIVSGELGSTPIFNWLLWGYGVPAASFGIASILLRRQADDQVVALCEALSVAFAGFLVSLELHHWVTGGAIMTLDLTHLGSGLQAFAALMMGVVLLAIEPLRRSAVLRAATYVFGGLGLGWAVLGLLLVNNPLFNGSSERILGGVFLNSLLVAYLLPAAAAFLLARLARGLRPDWFVRSALVLGFVLALAYVVLQVRRVYQGDVISWYHSTSDAESYTYSAVFLVIGLVLLGLGLLRGSREARLGSAVFITLAVLKAFLFDMAGLTGPFRALSFIGLGIVLVGIGLVYQKLVFRRPPAPPGPPAAGAPPPPPGPPEGGEAGPPLGEPATS